MTAVIGTLHLQSIRWRRTRQLRHPRGFSASADPRHGARLLRWQADKASESCTMDRIRA